MKFRQLKSQDVDKWAVHDINRLLIQLSEKTGRKSKEDVKGILEQQNAVIFVIFDEKIIIGVAGIHFRKPLMRTVGTIEDVVVLRKFRNKGFGRKLIELLIEEAKERGAVYVELTSKPNRKEANAMYESMGFKLVAEAVGKDGTNLYRLYL